MIKDCGSVSSGVMEKINVQGETFVISKMSSDTIIRKGFPKTNKIPTTSHVKTPSYLVIKGTGVKYFLRYIPLVPICVVFNFQQ